YGGVHGVGRFSSVLCAIAGEGEEHVFEPRLPRVQFQEVYVSILEYPHYRRDRPARRRRSKRRRQVRRTEFFEARNGRQPFWIQRDGGGERDGLRRRRFGDEIARETRGNDASMV